MATIISDEEVFSQIKEKSRKAYVKAWQDFKACYDEFQFEAGPPGEDILIEYFKHLREVKMAATTTLWTLYSYLNSVLKRKYNFMLQSLPRVTMLLKGFESDVKKKAAIFDEARLKHFMVEPMDNNTFWEVRQAISIVAFFGGLRLLECMELKLEQFSWTSDGCTITHIRAKQRSDKLSTKFLVPEAGGFATKLANYINRVKDQLEIFQGKAWYTGRKHGMLVKQAMGKNMVSQVPHDIASRLGLENVEKYTFHSFRRTSATSAADGGATTEQMVDFFGWRNGSMCTEYVSSIKPALLGKANRLVKPSAASGSSTASGDKVVMINHITEEKMDSEAGIPSNACSSAVANQQTITEASIKQAISAIPAVGNSNVNIKLVVVSNMSGGNITL